jgi:hypothetical protein
MSSISQVSSPFFSSPKAPYSSNLAGFCSLHYELKTLLPEPKFSLVVFHFTSENQEAQTMSCYSSSIMF